MRWAAIESVKILPDTSRIGAIREQVAHRRGNRNIGAVAAARRQLELVFYGLRSPCPGSAPLTPRGVSATQFTVGAGRPVHDPRYRRGRSFWLTPSDRPLRTASCRSRAAKE